MGECIQKEVTAYSYCHLIMYFVETSVIVDFLRGDKKSIKLLDGLEGDVTSSFVCMAELYEGVHRSSNKEKLENYVLTYFKSLSQVFGLDEIIAGKFGEVRSRLKSQGNIIEDMDLLIAATCLAYGLVLITKNTKHFSRVEGLDIMSI